MFGILKHMIDLMFIVIDSFFNINLNFFNNVGGGTSRNYLSYLTLGDLLCYIVILASLYHIMKFFLNLREG